MTPIDNDKTVTDLPTKGVPFKQVSGKELWAAPKPNDRQVWGVCPYLRNLERCAGCPEWEKDEDGEDVKIGCRGLAEEVCRIVMAARSET
jgi:hypothetical protein